MNGRLIVQSVALAIALIGLSTWIIWARKSGKWGYAALPVTYIAHVIVFYIVVILLQPPVNGEFYTTWSAVVRLQGVITILVGGAVMLWAKFIK